MLGMQEHNEARELILKNKSVYGHDHWTFLHMCFHKMQMSPIEKCTQNFDQQNKIK